MTDLLLQPAADSEGQLSNFDFDALPVANRWVASPWDAAGLMWFWAIDASLRGDRDRTEGHETSKEAAIQAFAKSWPGTGADGT
jgi:hypothetical protein